MVLYERTSFDNSVCVVPEASPEYQNKVFSKILELLIEKYRVIKDEDEIKISFNDWLAVSDYAMLKVALNGQNSRIITDDSPWCQFQYMYMVVQKQGAYKEYNRGSYMFINYIINTINMMNEKNKLNKNQYTRWQIVERRMKFRREIAKGECNISLKKNEIIQIYKEILNNLYLKVTQTRRNAIITFLAGIIRSETPSLSILKPKYAMGPIRRNIIEYAYN